MSDSYKIIKAFNNNILLVNSDGVEKIIIGKGIGFNKKVGDILKAPSNIEKMFTIQDPVNQNKFNELVSSVPEDIMSYCEEIISMLEKELNESLDESIHIALTDHISFSLKRLKENNEIVNPFLVETEVLFKKEFLLAKKAVKLLEERTGIFIPEGEAGFIALHIHSARNKGNLSNTVKYAYISNSISELIEQELNIKLDKESLYYARFIIHLRFTIERLIKNIHLKNELLSTIKRKYKASYMLSSQIGKILEANLNIEVHPDEIGYIAMHLETLKNVTKKHE